MNRIRVTAYLLGFRHIRPNQSHVPSEWIFDWSIQLDHYPNSRIAIDAWLTLDDRTSWCGEREFLNFLKQNCLKCRPSAIFSQEISTHREQCSPDGIFVWRQGISLIPSSRACPAFGRRQRNARTIQHIAVNQCLVAIRLQPNYRNEKE